MNNYYTLIVDTTAYSGNFEREMTAFMTGEVGECGVGDKFAGMFRAEGYDFSFQDSIYQKPDDEHGIRRPCEIAITPGYVNNGMGVQVLEDSKEAKSFTSKHPAYQSVAIYFNEDPSEHIAFLKHRAYLFEKYYNVYGSFGSTPSEKIKIIGFRASRTETKTLTVYI